MRIIVTVARFVVTNKILLKPLWTQNIKIAMPGVVAVAVIIIVRVVVILMEVVVVQAVQEAAAVTD